MAHALDRGGGGGGRVNNMLTWNIVSKGNRKLAKKKRNTNMHGMQLFISFKIIFKQQ